MPWTAELDRGRSTREMQAQKRQLDRAWHKWHARDIIEEILRARR
jgi:hypothetical protein